MLHRHVEVPEILKPKRKINRHATAARQSQYKPKSKLLCFERYVQEFLDEQGLKFGELHGMLPRISDYLEIYIDYGGAKKSCLFHQG